MSSGSNNSSHVTSRRTASRAITLTKQSWSGGLRPSVDFSDRPRSPHRAGYSKAWEPIASADLFETP
jgi:hypothetical protein